MFYFLTLKSGLDELHEDTGNDHGERCHGQYAEKDVKKRWSEDTPRIMTELMEVLRGIGDFSSKPSEDVVIGWITEKGYHMGNVMNAFRLAVVGECKGPHMFDITALLGKEETLARIQRAIDVLK